MRPSLGLLYDHTLIYIDVANVVRFRRSPKACTDDRQPCVPAMLFLIGIIHMMSHMSLYMLLCPVSTYGSPALPPGVGPSIRLFPIHFSLYVLTYMVESPANTIGSITCKDSGPPQPPITPTHTNQVMGVGAARACIRQVMGPRGKSFFFFFSFFGSFSFFTGAGGLPSCFCFLGPCTWSTTLPPHIPSSLHVAMV